MSKKNWFACGWSLLLLFGCEDTETPRCTPGESAECRGADGCEGVKICDTNGIVYGSCQCSTGSAGPRPSGSTPAASGCKQGATRACVDTSGCTGVATCGDSGTFGACQCATPPSQVPALRANVLGAACQGNSQCGSSLLCWAETQNGPGTLGGPAQGYCTALCQTSADCSLFQEPGDCIHFAGSDYGLCLVACGTEGVSDAGSSGCAGRSDLACVTHAALSAAAPQTPDRGLCVPFCSSDAECGARQCDHASPVSTCVGGPDAGLADAGPI